MPSGRGADSTAARSLPLELQRRHDTPVSRIIRGLHRYAEIHDSEKNAAIVPLVRDPLILVGVPILLIAVAVVACLAPANRAASIDPMEAVRHE